MDWLLVAARTVHFAATITLFGTFAFECLVFRPALATAGAAPTGSPLLARRFRRLASASLALALVSGAAWLLAVAARMSGQPLAAALSGGAWRIVLTRTDFGDDWLFRLGLAAGIAINIALGCLPALVRAAAWAGLAAATPLLAALAWAGHGAATPGAPGDLHLAADILHLLCAGLWLGMLPPLAILLVEARRGAETGGMSLAAAAVRRFSALSIGSVLLLLASGLVNAWFLVGSVPALIGTEYGRLLLAKIALFLGTLLIAAVNLLRLAPRLAPPAGAAGDAARHAALWLRRNGLAEAGIGLAILAIVGVLGIRPPGARGEPGWPLPFRIDVAALSQSARFLLLGLIVLFCVGAIALVAAMAAGRHRRAGRLAAALALCLGLGWLPLRPAIERAYPTSFDVPAEPYSAASIVRGATLYAGNCAMCHGEDARGDGAATAALPIRPADLTAAPLVARPPGDLFWWVSHGRGNGVMPGFAAVMTPAQRWDVVNFIRARAAGVLARGIGPQGAIGAALTVPDFAFERGRAPDTLRRMLRQGPVLLVLIASPSEPHLDVLATAAPGLAGAGLRVIAVVLGGPAVNSSLIVRVSAEIVPALALFRTPGDGGETDLLLDRRGDIRARWTAAGDSGLPNAAALIAAARRGAVAAAARHAGHVH
jgi:copper resistance protein D